jgi:hypothetical protein
MSASATFFSFLTIAGATATYLITTPGQEPTRGTTAQWKLICETEGFSCKPASVQDSFLSSAISYDACGAGRCFRVTCNAIDPEAHCGKVSLPAIKPSPRKLQTVVGSIL